VVDIGCSESCADLKDTAQDTHAPPSPMTSRREIDRQKSSIRMAKMTEQALGDDQVCAHAPTQTQSNKTPSTHTRFV